MKYAAVILNQSLLSTSSFLPHSLYKPRSLLLHPFKFASSFSISLPPSQHIFSGRVVHSRSIAGILSDRKRKIMTGSLAARLVLRRCRSPASQFFFRREASWPATERTTKDVVTSPPKELPAFDYSPPAYSGPSRDEIIAKRREYLSPSIFHNYKSPVRTHRTGSFQ